ncbi:hypothetical protein RHSIM_Rhsim04G0206000 [Rhododendron simsii]|uniref:Vacuole membrane protein KMS1 n=1 Tax=Rhododendron simsii TaxID=118357 RepID=A0A834H6K1_RHOSS|nr:hypothetical protein RHSIM_Rhsim04G0206000 [Rhododendron simsii]
MFQLAFRMEEEELKGETESEEILNSGDKYWLTHAHANTTTKTNNSTQPQAFTPQPTGWTWEPSTGFAREGLAARVMAAGVVVAAGGCDRRGALYIADGRKNPAGAGRALSEDFPALSVSGWSLASLVGELSSLVEFRALSEFVGLWRDSLEYGFAGLRERHQLELENLTLTTEPVKTVKFFVLAVLQYLKRTVLYLLAHGGWLMVLCTIGVLVGILLLTIDGPHEKHVEELRQYVQFGLWWVALGVASSIGLGSGLHTFVLYLGPHIALFTLKATQCGRVDIKSAPYDTIQLKRGPSWLDKDCIEFGPPVFSSLESMRVPLSSILPQIQMEAILWGLGTALGELPPYFISRAVIFIIRFVLVCIWHHLRFSKAIGFDVSSFSLSSQLLYVAGLSEDDFGTSRVTTTSMSDGQLEAFEELDASSSENSGVIATRLNQIKRWFLSHSQYLNFFTILVLASVPNPLFDLAGIMCGQFGIPFWKFFLATLIGKAIVKTHIQTVFIISVCNNQLLDWIENEMIWVLSFIPGLASALPNLVSKLKAMRAKYMATPPPMSSKIKVKKWDLSFTLIWNTIVWLMIMNFFIQIVTSTAQKYLKKQQDKELASMQPNES